MQQTFTKIKPLFQRVLISRIQPPQKTSGGIILTSGKQSPSNIGLVISIGEGKTNNTGVLIKTNLKEGNYVLLPEYGGVKVPKDASGNEDLFIYNEEDILGVVEGDFKH